MTYHYLAFFMGFFGSIHCAVMCGPLLIAVQGSQGVSWKQTFNKILYQSGRILTYGAIGFVLGMIGSLAGVLGVYQVLIVWTVFVLLALGVFYLSGMRSSALAQFYTIAVEPIVKLTSKWLYRPEGSFEAGIVTAIIACCMVYMA